MNKLLFVDGNSIANRAFYALPFLSNHLGKPSGAVFGFANILLKILQEEKPSHVVVAFDHARKTFRNEIYSEYKMQRKPTPEELKVQFPIIKEMLDVMGIKYIEQEGIEADDIIGTLTKKFVGEKIILSGDRDLLQLIDKNTCVWLTKKGVSDVDKVNPQRLKEIFNLEPYQIIELKGLMGDTSDNIPGVKGIGEKTALTLLESYSNITNIYENIENIKGKVKEKLIDGKEMAFTSKTLATINRECNIDLNKDDCQYKFPFDEKVYNFFTEWDFSSLVKNEKLFNKFNEKIVENNKIKLTTEILNNINVISNYFSYDLQKLEFYINDKLYYLENNFSIFELPLSIEDVCIYLKNYFENENITKYTLHAKDDMHFLSKLGINLKGYVDIALKNYLVTAGMKNGADNLTPMHYFEKDKELSEELTKRNLVFVYNEIEKPLTDLLFNMEVQGFKINEDKLDEIKIEFQEKIEELVQKIYFDAGEEFNINSPKQVAYILFEKLGIKSYNNKKQSTNANVLDELRFIPIVDNILTYRKYSKLVSTYVDVYKNICIETGDIIHTTFNQTLTSTGRLSSSEPNLQNIPTRDDDGKILRKIFESKFDGGKIISADYSQIELRLLADMSGEEKLIDSFIQGEDIHRLTASHIFNKDIADVTDNERRDAKAVNFGIIYGISDYGLSQSIKSTRAMAKEYIESYFTKYPKVKQFMETNVEKAKENGYSITKFGRIRIIPELSSSKYQTRTFGERVAMNMPLQGTASDIIKLAMLKVDKRLHQEALKSQLILQIHDELIVDTFPGEEIKVEKILKEEMGRVVTLKVPLTVSIGIGKNLYECK